MSADAAESETNSDGDRRDLPDAPRRFTDGEDRVLRFRSGNAFQSDPTS